MTTLNRLTVIVALGLGAVGIIFDQPVIVIIGLLIMLAAFINLWR